MIRSAKTTLLAFAIGFGAWAAAPAIANAAPVVSQSVLSGTGLVQKIDHRRDHNRWDDRRNDRRHDRRGGRECTPNRALDKADRMGIRRARIQDVNRHSIRVAGMSRGHPTRVIFSRAPGCPVLR